MALEIPEIPWEQRYYLSRMPDHILAQGLDAIEKVHKRDCTLVEQCIYHRVERLYRWELQRRMDQFLHGEVMDK